MLGGGLRKVWPSIINILQDFCTHGQKHKLKDTREGNMGEKKKSSTYWAFIIITACTSVPCDLFSVKMSIVESHTLRLFCKSWRIFSLVINDNLRSLFCACLLHWISIDPLQSRDWPLIWLLEWLKTLQVILRVFVMPYFDFKWDFKIGLK
jgi:hypothetical protein